MINRIKQLFTKAKSIDEQILELQRQRAALLDKQHELQKLKDKEAK